jgi:hypothetical protein
MRGCQCIKSLYLNKHQPQLKDDISVQHQASFDRGTSVGELARQLFPRGIDASPEFYYDYQKSVAYTEELMISGQSVIYEAAFQFKGVLAAIDILVMVDGQWKGYEVKSTTGVKETHLLDAALQYYVITQAGIILTDISIVHLNNQYTRKGELDIKQLFTIESIMEQVLEKQEFVAAQIPKLKKVITQTEIPVVDIGPHCGDPYPCDFVGHCWQHIPQPSVFDIAHLREIRKFELYQQGIIRFEDITQEVELNDNQRRQVDCHLNKTNYLDRPRLHEFLSGLSYPLYFMDFETFNPAIPLYDHSRAYQQIPFQYSIHYKKNRTAELRHTEFLALPTSDPRLAFAEQLLSKTYMPGDILTYNQAFEKTRLKELADDFPRYAEALHERISRIKDLMPPFQQRLYYTPEMNGAYSIKDVLPALVPELKYDDLPINNGSDASLFFEKMIYEPAADNAAIRNNLLAYCKLDTLAMVKLLEKLEDTI